MVAANWQIRARDLLLLCYNKIYVRDIFFYYYYFQNSGVPNDYLPPKCIENTFNAVQSTLDL